MVRLFIKDYVNSMVYKKKPTKVSIEQLAEIINLFGF